MGGVVSVEDRLAIRELVEAYNDAVMRFDGDTWSSTWCNDALWCLAGRQPVRGRAAILATWRELMASFSSVGFFAQAGDISIDGDRGEGRWWQQEMLLRTGGGRTITFGVYADHYVREAGQWFFSRRDYRVIDRREG